MPKSLLTLKINRLNSIGLGVLTVLIWLVLTLPGYHLVDTWNDDVPVNLTAAYAIKGGIPLGTLHENFRSGFGILFFLFNFAALSVTEWFEWMDSAYSAHITVTLMHSLVTIILAVALSRITAQKFPFFILLFLVLTQLDGTGHNILLPYVVAGGSYNSFGFVIALVCLFNLIQCILSRPQLETSRYVALGITYGILIFVFAFYRLNYAAVLSLFPLCWFLISPRHQFIRIGLTALLTAAIPTIALYLGGYNMAGYLSDLVVILKSSSIAGKALFPGVGLTLLMLLCASLCTWMIKRLSSPKAALHIFTIILTVEFLLSLTTDSARFTSLVGVVILAIPAFLTLSRGTLLAAIPLVFATVISTVAISKQAFAKTPYFAKHLADFGYKEALTPPHWSVAVSNPIQFRRMVAGIFTEAPFTPAPLGMEWATRKNHFFYQSKELYLKWRGSVGPNSAIVLGYTNLNTFMTKAIHSAYQWHWYHETRNYVEGNMEAVEHGIRNNNMVIFRSLDSIFATQTKYVLISCFFVDHNRKNDHFIYTEERGEWIVALRKSALREKVSGNTALKQKIHRLTKGKCGSYQF